MKTKMRLGLIGAGGIALTYVQALGQSATAELVGVADVRTERAIEPNRAAVAVPHTPFEAREPLAGGLPGDGRHEDTSHAASAPARPDE